MMWRGTTKEYIELPDDVLRSIDLLVLDGMLRVKLDRWVWLEWTLLTWEERRL